jgi:roadblock/LC7 domain-containing protein
MKYLTKEWYELCQKTFAHFQLEEDKQAEYFSEEYFQRLYNQKLAEWMDFEEKIASISAYRAHEIFDGEKAKEEFQLRLKYHIDHAKEILPEEILKDIADIRVYALDKGSHKVVEAVTQFCENNKRIVDRAAEEYARYYKDELIPNDCGVVKNIKFHDCIITEVKLENECISISFDNSGGFTDIVEMQLHNYKIIKQDYLLENSWWLYEEVYMRDGKYELHVLLDNKNIGLFEFTVLAENISFKRNESK